MLVLIVTVLLGQESVDQGAPGNQGPWPVTVVSTNSDGGSTDTTAAAYPITCDITSVHQSTVVDTSATIVPGNPTGGRLYVNICNSVQNTPSSVVKCRADGVAPVAASGNAGDVLLFGDCVLYSGYSATAIQCIADAQRYVTTYECVSGGTPESFALNGATVPLQYQCDGNQLFTEAPVQAVGVTRASSAYCHKSDGTVVLLASDIPRRERAGLLAEVSAVNLIGASGAAARDLTAAGWTASNMTCTKTAIGADNTANGASTCAATGSNGTITYAVVVGSSKRSSSMYLKRRTGSGAVTVTRNNFVTGTDVSASLSSTAWSRIWNDCGGRGSDVNFSTIDNCVAASNMTATAANPTVGVKLATSGDAVDVDFVQDEATDYPTSPMSGFDRALDVFTITLDGGLPVTAGQLSYDWESQRGSGADPAGNLPILLGTGPLGSGSAIIPWVATDTGTIGAYIRNATGLSQLGPVADGLFSGRGRNHRVTWGSGNVFLFFDGIGAAKISDGSAKLPTTHTGPYTLACFAADDTLELGGWVTRVQWTAGAVTSFSGSALAPVIVGDSITEAANNQVHEGQYPEQVLQSDIGGRASNIYVTNIGTSGATIDQCVANARGLIDNAVDYGAKGPRVIVFQCGINSSSDGAASVWGKINTLIFDSIDAGVRFLPATITPSVSNDPFIQGVNTLMRNVLNDAGIRFADTYHAMESPPDSGILNPAYDFGDGTHVNGAGAVAEATVWYGAGHDAGYW